MISIHSDTKTHLPLVAILVCVSQRDNIDFKNNIMRLKKIPFYLVFKTNSQEDNIDFEENLLSVRLKKIPDGSKIAPDQREQNDNPIFLLAL